MFGNSLDIGGVYRDEDHYNPTNRDSRKPLTEGKTRSNIKSNKSTIRIEDTLPPPAPRHQAKDNITHCGVSHAVYSETDIQRRPSLGEITAMRTVNQLTANLCEACRHIEKNGLIYRVSGELRAWWSNHRKAERKGRKFKKDNSKDGKLREKALKKLTSEEMQALGLC